MAPVAQLLVRVRGLRAQVGANDAPLLRYEGSTPLALQYPLNAWLLPEGNLLTALFSPLDEEDSAPGFDLSLTGPDPGGAPLARLSWSLPEGAEFEPFALSLPFTPSEYVESSLWEHGEPVSELDDAELDAARALCAELHAAFARRDLDGVTRLLDFRTREMASAFEWELDAHRAEVRESFREVFDDEGYGVTPVEVSALRFTPCGADRALHVARADGGELIGMRVSRSREEQAMQVYVGRVDGRWLVVR